MEFQSRKWKSYEKKWKFTHNFVNYTWKFGKNPLFSQKSWTFSIQNQNDFHLKKNHLCSQVKVEFHWQNVEFSRGKVESSRKYVKCHEKFGTFPQKTNVFLKYDRFFIHVFHRRKVSLLKILSKKSYPLHVLPKPKYTFSFWYSKIFFLSKKKENNTSSNQNIFPNNVSRKSNNTSLYDRSKIRFFSSNFNQNIKTNSSPQKYLSTKKWHLSTSTPTPLFPNVFTNLLKKFIGYVHTIFLNIIIPYKFIGIIMKYISFPIEPYHSQITDNFELCQI